MVNIDPVFAFKDNYIWVITNASGDALVVDPGQAQPVFNYLEEHDLKLKAILITHHHADHTGGVMELIQDHSVPVWGAHNSLCPYVTHVARENDFIDFDGFPVYRVIETPGHTLDHIVYYGEGALFCGDTLFTGGCGRIFEGDALQMFQSLEKLAQLPDETYVYCAHEYTLLNLSFAQVVEPANQLIRQRIQKTQQLRAHHQPSVPSLLREEKQTNPFLRCALPGVITAAEGQASRFLHRPVDVFHVIRQWKDNF